MDFTFIIPYYNNSNRIKDTIDSIINQKNIHYYKYEIIIIDDYSLEDEYDYLDTIKTPKITIHRQNTNKGPGVARNTGIELAKGEYILFVDSDDRLELNLLEQLDPLLINKLDIIVFDYYLIRHNYKVRQSMFFSEKKEDIAYDKWLSVFSKSMPWGKVFRTEFIKENEIKFLNTMRGEDIPFTKTAFFLADTVKYLSVPLYNYVMHEGSIMHKADLIDQYSLKLSLNMIYESLITKNKFYSNKEEFLAVYLKEFIYGSLFSMIRGEKKVLRLKAARQDLDENFPGWKYNKYVKEFPFHIQLCIKLLKLRMYNTIIVYEKIKYLIQKGIGTR